MFRLHQKPDQAAPCVKRAQTSKRIRGRVAWQRDEAARRCLSRRRSPEHLSAFLEENFRLVTVFGALVAVSTFASNLALRAIGIALSFLFLVAAMLVWVELWRRLPWRGAHWVLFLFRSTLTLITGVIILYWFVFFRDYLGSILPVVLTLVLVLIIARVAQRAGLPGRLRGALGIRRAAGRGRPVSGRSRRYQPRTCAAIEPGPGIAVRDPAGCGAVGRLGRVDNSVVKVAARRSITRSAA